MDHEAEARDRDVRCERALGAQREDTGTIHDLIRAGFRRFRRPEWNPEAYLESQGLSDGRVGPWLVLVDPPSEAALNPRPEDRPKLLIIDPATGAHDPCWIGVRLRAGGAA